MRSNNEALKRRVHRMWVRRMSLLKIGNVDSATIKPENANLNGKSCQIR